MLVRNELYEKLSEERKQLQKEGKIPEWITTAGWQLIKNKDYLYKTNSLKELFQRVANTLAKHLKPEHQDYYKNRFFEVLWAGHFSLSTPMYNLGTDRGLPVSCTGNYISDSVFSFYDSLLEVSMLTKDHFGTSGYLGDIRPRGSKISKGGTASGILPVMKMHAQAMNDITQGTTRRGSWGGYIDVMHGDFDEVLDEIMANPEPYNLGINYYDVDLIKLSNNEPEMVRRYQRHMKLRAVYGKGYFYFPDRVARLQPEMYKKHGLRSKASNLCLTGDTVLRVVETDKSSFPNFYYEYKTLKEIVESNKEYNVFSYNESTGQVSYKYIYDKALMKKDAELWELSVENGRYRIYATADHKIYTDNRGYIELSKLDIGDILIISDYDKVGDGDYENCHSTTSWELRKTEMRADVYDISVDDNHNFFANNVLVHNCSEVTLHADKDHSFTCVLGNMNLAKFDEWKDTDACQVGLMMLDCVVSEMLDLIDKKPEHEKYAYRKIKSGTEKSRALGLGVLGFHTYLQQKMIPFESMEAIIENENLFKYIHDETLKMSQWLAKEYGEPEWCKGFGVRNTHRTMIAPTTAGATIQNGVSRGIEPIYANTYSEKLAGGLVSRINPQLLQIMKDRNVLSQELIDDIGTNYKGSVQHVNWLTDIEKQVFKTAFEIDQKVLVDLAADRQKYVCQAQSINLFFEGEADEQEMSRIHLYAMFNPNIKSLYYMRGQRNAKASDGKSSVEESKSICESCEA